MKFLLALVLVLAFASATIENCDTVNTDDATKCDTCAATFTVAFNKLSCIADASLVADCEEQNEAIKCVKCAATHFLTAGATDADADTCTVGAVANCATQTESYKCTTCATEFPTTGGEGTEAAPHTCTAAPASANVLAFSAVLLVVLALF